MNPPNELHPEIVGLIYHLFSDPLIHLLQCNLASKRSGNAIWFWCTFPPFPRNIWIKPVKDSKVNNIATGEDPKCSIIAATWITQVKDFLNFNINPKFSELHSLRPCPYIYIKFNCINSKWKETTN